MSRPSGLLFDIDGTLVDTTYLHALAWWRGLADCGEQVDFSRVHRMIGAGSSVLLRELADEERDDIKEAWSRHFDALKGEVRAFAGAQDLLRALAARGGSVVLASSSAPEDLEVLQAAIGADDVLTAVVAAGDVDEAKPDPEVFQVAMDRAGAPPDRSIAVGDTTWDVEAARRCGLRTVGVLTGGFSEAELREAGAVAVYRDVAHLLAELDTSPLADLIDPA